MVDAAWVALSLVERVGGKTLLNLMQHFNHDCASILAADETALRKVPGVGPKIAASIRAINLQQVEQDIPRWQQAGIRIIPFNESSYPPRLRQLEDAPPTLFVRGEWQPFTRKSVAIVGTRRPSDAARAFAQNLASQLVERGYIIVSGLAVGIDAAAHMGTLALPQGCTQAVLGSGVMNLYPPENEALAQGVMRNGALVSELHPYKSTSPSSLVARNRIISGLSDGIVVVETETDGGAMHAAHFAGLQGRTVYTLESPASGNRALLKDGAVALRADLRDLPF